MLLRYIFPTRMLWISLCLSIRLSPTKPFSVDVNRLFRFVSSELVLFDFTKANPPMRFYSADDPVMGGRSRSEMSVKDNRLVFSGYLSLANNGGFASSYLSARLPDLKGYKKLRISLQGDGRRYGLSLLSRLNQPSVVHRYYFSTVKDEPMNVEVPFADMYATRRWETLPASVKVNPSGITALGFIIADKIEQPFELKISRITAVQ